MSKKVIVGSFLGLLTYYWLFGSKKDNNTNQNSNEILANPLDGDLVMRNDTQGQGHFGASRGERKHEGLDILCNLGDTLYTPINGKIQRQRFQVYSDTAKKEFVGVEIINDIYKIWIFYAECFLEKGTTIEAGQAIAKCQARGKYNNAMNDHIHIQIWKHGVLVNPIDYFHIIT